VLEGATPIQEIERYRPAECDMAISFIEEVEPFTAEVKLGALQP
jgi:hypothetical protein